MGWDFMLWANHFFIKNRSTVDLFWRRTAVDNKSFLLLSLFSESLFLIHLFLSEWQKLCYCHLQWLFSISALNYRLTRQFCFVILFSKIINRILSLVLVSFQSVNHEKLMQKNIFLINHFFIRRPFLYGKPLYWMENIESRKLDWHNHILKGILQYLMVVNRSFMMIIDIFIQIRTLKKVPLNHWIKIEDALAARP